MSSTVHAAAMSLIGGQNVLGPECFLAQRGEPDNSQCVLGYDWLNAMAKINVIDAFWLTSFFPYRLLLFVE